MLLIFFVCFCLTTSSHAGNITNSNDTTSSTTSAPNFLTGNTAIDNELLKISSSCLNNRDNELLAGDILKHRSARTLSTNLISISSMDIGLAELRRALNFAPLPPWKPYNGTEPSKEELASAPSLEAYYDLVEPISAVQSLDNEFFFEKNIVTAIAFIDKRLPSVRLVFRRRFEEMMHQLDGKLMDRKLVDRMLDEYSALNDKIDKAVWKMIRNGYKCWNWPKYNV
ncbi:unnamed protein product [Caenorhabditis brenneri]